LNEIENVEQNTGINRKEEKKEEKFLIFFTYCTTFIKVRLRLAKFAFHQKFFFLIASTSPVLFAGSTFINLGLFRSLKLLFYQRSVKGMQPA